ncbi:Ku protein [Mesorhizobium sp. DCY119]|uniref:non-homologous end joining protein Ku n=1 Tax=Mesorhizobium sp. DCY119 TaxID=2108445 RepID=UPI000E7224FB|nr:Ku protein [Mesorhizobium sp. DCY119]RJG41611.1 Ku protein [Mesorhizobium sp. DCY119]
MTARAIWKGHLKVAELVCPVSMYAAASTSERISFHVLNRKTGNRVHRQFVDEETGKPIDQNDLAKGYETSDGNFVILDEEEIAEAIPESDKMLAMETFIKCGDVDTLYLDRPYYLVPSEPAGEKAFNVIRDGMNASGVVGLARSVLFRRVRTVMIRGHDSGLVANMLNFDYEIRPAKEVFDGISKIKIEAEMLDLAKHIIKTKTGKFDPSKFDDRYEDALNELVKAKLEGRKIKKPKIEREEKVINLMDALRKSADAGKKNSPTRSSGVSGRRAEMMLLALVMRSVGRL